MQGTFTRVAQWGGGCVLAGEGFAVSIGPKALTLGSEMAAVRWGGPRTPPGREWLELGTALLKGPIVLFLVYPPDTFWSIRTGPGFVSLGQELYLI